MRSITAELIILFVALLTVSIPSITYVYAYGGDIPQQYVDTKYCGPPKRNSKGDIMRSATAIKYFRLQNPCPTTHLTTGACPEYSIDHPRPLASCGCDTPSNMQWLKNTIKSCAGTECKDRWERVVYICKPEDIVPTPIPIITPTP